MVNYASSIANKLEALLTDDARVVIYDHHVFIVQATDSRNLSDEIFVFLHCFTKSLLIGYHILTT